MRGGRWRGDKIPVEYRYGSGNRDNNKNNEYNNECHRVTECTVPATLIWWVASQHTGAFVHRRSELTSTVVVMGWEHPASVKERKG